MLCASLLQNYLLNQCPVAVCQKIGRLFILYQFLKKAIDSYIAIYIATNYRPISLTSIIVEAVVIRMH